MRILLLLLLATASTHSYTIYYANQCEETVTFFQNPKIPNIPYPHQLAPGGTLAVNLYNQASTIKVPNRITASIRDDFQSLLSARTFEWRDYELDITQAFPPDITKDYPMKIKSRDLSEFLYANNTVVIKTRVGSDIQATSTSKLSAKALLLDSFDITFCAPAPSAPIEVQSRPLLGTPPKYVYGPTKHSSHY